MCIINSKIAKYRAGVAGSWSGWRWWPEIRPSQVVLPQHCRGMGVEPPRCGRVLSRYWHESQKSRKWAPDPGPVWPAPFNGWEEITNICIFDFRCALGALENQRMKTTAALPQLLPPHTSIYIKGGCVIHQGGILRKIAYLSGRACGEQRGPRAKCENLRACAYNRPKPVGRPAGRTVVGTS